MDLAKKKKKVIDYGKLVQTAPNMLIIIIYGLKVPMEENKSTCRLSVVSMLT
jgi:hypothetical protein